METNFNIGSLKIVSNPLMEYFKKIQNNLSDNIQLVNDKKVPVNFESIEILKKVSGTLKMIGLVGVNKVLSTVSESLELVKSAKYDTAKSLAVLQSSSQIVSSVVFYLENLLKGEQDQPTKFFDEYSTLCKLIGKDAQIKDLFSPKLEFRPETGAELQSDLKVGAFINSGNKEKLVDLLKANHEVAQNSVVALFEMLNKQEYNTSEEKSKYQNVIKNLYSILDVNQKLNLSKNIYLVTGLQKLFLSIISPVFNDNFNELINSDLNSIKLNLGKIERSTKFVLDSILKMDESDKTGTLKLEEDVVREVLFFVITVINQPQNNALKNMPVYTELVSLFNLDFYANQLKETRVEVSLAQKNPEVAAQIDKLFVEIKEELSLLTSKQAEKEEFALQHSIKFINVITKFSDLMGPVSSGKLKDLINLVCTAITSVKNKEIKLSESLQKEISLSLVLIEYGINNFVKSLISPSQKEGFEVQASLQISRLTLSIENKEEELSNAAMPVLDAGSQKSDERKAFLIIFDKLHKDLKKSEEILNDLFRDNSSTEDLDQVFKTLNSAKGIFSIINKNELSKILTNIISIWKQVGAEGFGSVDSKELANSVSLLSGILLFIESSKNDNENEANEMYDRIISRTRVAQPVEQEHKPLNLPSDVLQEYEFDSTPEETVEELSVPELELPVIETPVHIAEPVFEVEENIEALNELPEVLPLVEPQEELALEEFSFEPEEIHAPVVQDAEPASLYIDNSDDPDLTEVYLMEAEEVLENITKSCEALNDNLQDMSEVTNIRRYFHTLKGSGRMVGLKYLGEAGWMVEQTLNKILNSDLELTYPMLSDLVLTKNQFDSWVEELKATNFVAVDLVKYKQIWLKHNSHLTTQIEIPDAPVAHEEVTLDESVAVEPAFEVQEEVPVEEPVESIEMTFEDVSSVEESKPVESLNDNSISFDDFVLDTKTEPVQVVDLEETHQPVSEEVTHEEVSEELNTFEVDLGETEEPVQEPEFVEEKKDTVTINGLEVSSSLYHLFKEESETHLQELRASTHNHEDLNNGFEVSKDFMRHAHTLASIAKSVNMDVFSSMVAKIEFIANICIDKKIKLNESDFFILKNAVDNLDVFANVMDGSLESNQHYEDVDNKLDGLLNSLTNLPEETVEVEAVAEPVHEEVVELHEQAVEEPQPVLQAPVAAPAPAPVNINELVEAISLNIAHMFKSNLENLKDSLESVKNEVSSIKDSVREDVSLANQSKQEIDVNGLIDSINQHVVSAVGEQYEKLNNALKQKDAEEKEKSNALTQRMANLANELEVLNKNQQNVEKMQKENYEALKKDLRYLNYTIKKKHSVSYREVGQESNGEIKEVQSLSSDQVEVIALQNDVGYEENSYVEPLNEISEEVVTTDNVETTSEDPSSEVLGTEEVFDAQDAEINQEEFNFAKEDLTLNQEEVADVEQEQFDEISDEEFAGVEDLPSDIAEAEKLKNINETLTQVKSSNTILDFLNNNEFVKTIFEEKVSTVEDEIDDEIFEISKMETDEILETISSIMDSINDDVLDLAQNEELKRHLHTLKGSVRMAGANKVGAIAHRLESLLDYSESRHISLYKMKDLLADELNKVVYLLSDTSVVLTKDKANWIDGSYEAQEEIKPQVNTFVDTISDVAEVKVVAPTVKREEKQFIRIGANLIDGLINEAGEVRLTRTTLEGMLAGNRKSLTELKNSAEKLVKNLKEIEVQAETQISARKEKQQDSKDFDPLEFDRFTRLQEVTRFMNEAVTDVQDTISSMETFLKTQDGAVVQQAILTNNLLDTLMKVRLLPVDNISDRLYKITRNTAKELNKKVTLDLFGEKTEMDRLVLDKIVSPLEHLLRNCIAHGIEEPAERISKGKSVLGKVVMRTSVDGNFIVMNIKDDGAGINVDKVRSLGLKKGLLKYDTEYSEQQIIELIFNSGFSTSDSITQVSGRGVGMDVVKKEISELGGSIDIKTEKDKGTEFNIVLPVAVATNQAMLTKIAGKLVAIPALIVDEVSSLKKDKMQSAYMSGHVEIKGNKYPLYYLGHMLGLTPVSQLPELKVYNTLIAVTYLGETVVVHVDELQTTSEILIKTMGVHFGKISGVLGATLLGDGRQGLVVNPVMLKNHYEQNIKTLNIFNEGTTVTSEKMTGVITVMVVDDSVTVRRATTKVLERYGYNIVLAKDGEDGLEQLQVVIPDIILSDIEMPRMDGFEFAKNVKNTEKYAHIPIVMITSRTADKHKNYAYSLGVDGFLGKPYQEEELIETIKRLVGTLH
jgi:chemosensory pili system protein ChpA (sensor histidine kinase/response regulator)